MTYPTTAVDTTNADAGTDVPALFRTDVLDAIQKLNQMIAHTSAFAATLLEDTSANDARATLGSTTVGDAVFVAANAAAARTALAAAASGVNADINQLTGITDYTGSLAFRSYLSGLTLSTAGGSATMSIAAGVAMDSTNTMLMQLAAINKTTSAWAVGTGNGGLDTGAIANSTWYHWFAIRRPDTGVVDALCSLSATAPTMPTNYTQFRRIGSGRTNGSAQWTSFTQDGDYFRLAASVLDVGLLNPGTSAVSATLTVPTGVKVGANINVVLADSTNLGSAAYISDLATPDEAPSVSAAPLFSTSQIATLGVAVAANLIVRTNTSAQIRYRCNTSYASLAFRIATLGWYDTRGKDA